MKKTIKSLILVAIAALGIAGCDDVPAPFVEPGGDEPELPTDGGTWDAPLTVAELISNQTGNTVWVHGYIVGSIPEAAESTTLSNMTFTADGAHTTNICIAGSATETVAANCVPVQLPAGSDAREMLNLKDNPGKLGAEVWLKGTSEKYCGAPGLKSVSKFTLVAPTEEDDKEDGDTPVEGAKGDGSLENPFNPAAALNYTVALPAGETTTEKFYIKGIVCESSKMDISTQYKNATFHISEDGTASGAQFLIFRTKGLNGADITSADDVKVGDEVVVYASLVNYMGNTPETAQGGIIYSQKRNGEELKPDGGDDPVTPGTAVTCSEAVELCNALADGATSEEAYTISGYITEIISAVSRDQQSFWMADTKDGGRVFQAYWANLPEGVAEFKVGSQVKITGNLIKYVNNSGEVVPEMKNATVEIVSVGEGGDEGGDEGGETPVGENIFENGDFELWEAGVPVNWKSKSTAGNVAVEQSTDAHSGTYAASMGYAASSNKRMAYKEITLAAGTYKFCFYAKGTNTEADAKCQTRPGYVGILEDGSADSSHYNYGDYATLSANEWKLVEYEFTLTAATTICPVIMSPKGSSYHTSQNILVDDATLVKLK